jgi:hypothetical protein
MLVLAGLTLMAPAAANASRPTPLAARLCPHHAVQASAHSARPSLRRLHAACGTYGSVISAANTSYSERISRDSKSAASNAVAKRSAEEALGTQYEKEIAPAVAALNSAYAAAAAALVNSVTGATGPLCSGPLSGIPLVSHLVCSTYTDTIGAAQAAFRAATAPANASYAKQWAAIQSKYHGLNRALAADRCRAGHDLNTATARAAASFRRAAGA